MEVLFKKVSVPLMMIHNNVYVFLSGIFVSLSINIFTSLCFERASLSKHWHLYLATLFFLLASALFMYIAAKISKFQNYIIEKRVIEHSKKHDIIIDATKNNRVKWVIIFALIVFIIIVGAVLLVMNFIL
jgi:hypothetical protein